jgi:hypothetical protein
VRSSGSKIRAGIVEVRLQRSADFPDGVVHEVDVWRYADEATKPTRGDALKRLGAMLRRLVRRAEKHHQLTLAPFVGVACPGVIAADGSIERGGQNLPGNWRATGSTFR